MVYPGQVTIGEVKQDDAAVRILVVEDDPQVRDMLSLLLSARWRVEVADGGPAALGVVRRCAPDLVISDLRMPGIDGISLLRRLRDDPATQSVPVILVTAQAGEQETIAGLEAGADDFLVKPFSARELLVRVQTRLEVTAMRRRNAQQAAILDSLRWHTAWTEQLLDSMPVPLFLLEPGSNRVLFANRAATSLGSTTVSRGSPLPEEGFCLPDDQGGRTLRPDEITPAAREERVEGRRIVWHTTAGPRSVLADSVLLPAVGDHAPEAVLTLRDVSALVGQEADLRRSLRTRDEFLSVASHELRTPLTTLTLQTETLLKAQGADAPNERMRRGLSTIRRQIARLEQLVDVLLDVSRLIEGRLELRAEEVDLCALAAESIDLLSESATRAGSTIGLHTQGAVIGCWDRLRVGQVITNLLSNAIKFGRGAPIDIDVRKEVDLARLEVRDHGIGVPRAECARIFDRFARASSEQHFAGLGLGLWISKQIVDACGGTIFVLSEPGQGAAFVVQLPCNA